MVGHHIRWPSSPSGDSGCLRFSLCRMTVRSMLIFVIWQMRKGNKETGEQAKPATSFLFLVIDLR